MQNGLVENLKVTKISSKYFRLSLVICDSIFSDKRELIVFTYIRYNIFKYNAENILDTENNYQCSNGHLNKLRPA
jgi:hypothetical protein